MPREVEPEPPAEVPRRPRKRPKGPSATAFVAVTLVVAGVGAVAWQAWQRQKELELDRLERAAQVPVAPVEPDPSINPFEGFTPRDADLLKRPSQGPRLGGNAFAMARRLSPDSTWTSAVERAERAYTLLEEAGRLKDQGGDWRKTARDARELLAKALEQTEAFEERLSTDTSKASTYAGVQQEREVWRRREYELHRQLGSG